MKANYIYLECFASSFKGKNGETVEGYFVYILERVVKNDRVYHNVIRQWTNTACYFDFGTPLDCIFDSRGKLISFSERG